jgi:hypothetical protein
VCDATQKSCEVHEATLDAFLNGGVKVRLIVLLKVDGGKQIS